jgi:hypothetical protein
LELILREFSPCILHTKQVRMSKMTTDRLSWFYFRQFYFSQIFTFSAAPWWLRRPGTFWSNQEMHKIASVRISVTASKAIDCGVKLLLQDRVITVPQILSSLLKTCLKWTKKVRISWVSVTSRLRAKLVRRVLCPTQPVSTYEHVALLTYLHSRTEMSHVLLLSLRSSAISRYRSKQNIKSTLLPSLRLSVLFRSECRFSPINHVHWTVCWTGL